MATADDTANDAHPTRRKRGLYGAGTVILFALLMLLLWWLLGSKGEDIRALLVASRDHYEEKYDSLPALAEAVQTPEAAVGFAQTKISISIYEDRLQTPEEVLKTRTANPADAAMFLRALLSELQVDTVAKASALPDDARTALVIDNSVAERPLPDALRRLMAQIGYDGDDIPQHTRTQVQLAIDTLQEARSLTDQALERADTLLDLDGQSSVQPAYMDWVWLEAADGTIYDPVLPDRPRPDTVRTYDAPASKTRVSLSAVNAYGETRDMVAWEGAAYGEPVSVTFVPAIDPAGRLAGDPDMSDVEVWTPVLSVGSDHDIGAAVNRDGDVAPLSLIQQLLAQNEVPSFDAPTVTNLQIRALDVSRWPRVHLGLSAAVDGTPRWQGAHFSVSIAGTTPPVRIEQPFSAQRNVILVADQSGSTLENDHHAWIKTFGRILTDGLSTNQRVAVATFGNDPVFHKLFQAEPLIDFTQAIYDDAWQQPVRGQGDFVKALDHALNAILIELGPDPQERTDIILATDGKAGQVMDAEWLDTLAEIRTRAATLNAAITPVVMGASEDIDLAQLARETGGRLIRITERATLQSRATALANELAGGMRISFKMPLEPQFDKDSTVPFTLDLDGYDGQETAELIVPDTITVQDPGIYLNVSTGTHTTSRPMIALGDDFDFRTLIGRTDVFLAAGPYDTNQVIGGRINNWITYYDIKSDNEEALTEAAQTPRISVAQMQTVNGLSSAVELGLSADQNTRFPMLAIKRTHIQEVEDGTTGQVALLNDLDVPAWGPLAAHTASKRDVARAGFLLNDAEARLNNSGQNLTRQFVEAGDIRAQTKTDDRQTLLLNSSLNPGQDSLLFADASTDSLFWHARENSGRLRGFGLWGDIPLKGSRDVEIAARFAEIQTAIGAYNYAVQQSAAMGAAMAGAEAAAAMPAAVALGGLIAFKSEELKLWCYSTIMLGYVNEVIEGDEDAILNQSAEAAGARAAELCKMEGGPQDFGKNAFKAASKGFFDAWANQFEIPQVEDPTANVRDAYDKAQRMYKHFYPTPKNGEQPPTQDRLQRLVKALDKYGNGDGPSLQTQLVNKAFTWGTSSFSPAFRADLSGAIAADLK
ncbi:MAG: vWA domain-containing protein [Pseudomonadota bacterium]